MRSSVDDAVLGALTVLEEKHSIKVLYAAEAGSRAWGFPSGDSDYDVRFIYVEKMATLCSLYPPDDTIESMTKDVGFDLDMAGWSLRKTLQLMRKSNAGLLEWLYSPIEYLDSSAISLEIADLAEQYVDDKTLVHHYANMAQRCLAEHLRTPLVKLKKYFYCIRPILAADFVSNTFRSDYQLPPVDFHDLFSVSRVPEPIRFKIEQLLKRKALSSSESDKEPQDLELLDWIESSITRLRTTATKIMPKASSSRLSHDHLDQFYYEQVMKYDRISSLE